MALFEIRNLTFTYPGQEKPALTDLSFSLEQGEFLVVCGKSGCGKSTLLRHFKTAMSPYGERKGHILLEGRELDTVSVREQGARIGYVLQSPDNQLVTDKVWHELAFGLENLGYETGTIRLRVAVRHVRSYDSGSDSGQQLFRGRLRRGTDKRTDRSCNTVLRGLWNPAVPCLHQV